MKKRIIWGVSMIEKRFKSTLDEETMSIMPYIVSDNEEECFYNLQDCVDLLNKQQVTITELERKLKKYAKIGEEQLKQIMELQDELQECRARPTLATDEKGFVKVEYR